MENQPGFDLNDALLRWRRDLAGQPGIADEDIRELETHLLEGLSAFQRRGMSEESAFAKAKEKLGSAAVIGAEFAKAHRLRIWRDRVFWIGFLTFAVALCSSATAHPVMEMARRLRDELGTVMAALVASALSAFPTLLLCAVMVSGFAEFVYRKCWWFFCKRWRLGVAGVLGVIAANLFTYRITGVLVVFELGFLGFATVVIPRELRAASALNYVQLADWRKSIGVWRDRLFWLLLANLAIGAWTMVIWACADGYLLSLPDAKRGAIPAIVSVPFFLSWLGPMGVVGLGLWAGRLSVISQALNSRRQAVRIASGLTLVGVGLRYWLSTWKVSTHLFSTADWRFAFVVDTIASLLLGAVAVALIVWILPWQRQSRMPHAKE